MRSSISFTRIKDSRCLSIFRQLQEIHHTKTELEFNICCFVLMISDWLLSSLRIYKEFEDKSLADMRCSGIRDSFKQDNEFEL